MEEPVDKKAISRTQKTPKTINGQPSNEVGRTGRTGSVLQEV